MPAPRHIHDHTCPRRPRTPQRRRVLGGFYTIPASKRSVYLLPAYPFAAYALAAVFMRMRLRWPAAVMAWLLSGLAVAAPVALLVYGAMHDGFISNLGYASLAAPMVAGAWWLLRRSRPVASSVMCAAALYLA